MKSRTIRPERLRSPLVAVIALSLLGGCAFTGVATVDPEPGRVEPARVEHRTASGGIDVEPEEGGTLRIVGTYRAASGRLCRRLADRRGVVLARTSCRQADGEWTLGRSLGKRWPDDANAAGHRSRFVEPSAPSADAGAVESVEPAASGRASAEPPEAAVRPPAGAGSLDGVGAATEDRELVHERLHEGETLWAFAARMTGDPRNYRRIARLNGIEDLLSVESGRSLAVPASIASLAR